MGPREVKCSESTAPAFLPPRSASVTPSLLVEVRSLPNHVYQPVTNHFLVSYLSLCPPARALDGHKKPQGGTGGQNYSPSKGMSRTRLESSRGDITGDLASGAIWNTLGFVSSHGVGTAWTARSTHMCVCLHVCVTVCMHVRVHLVSMCGT